MGAEIGKQAFRFALNYFQFHVLGTEELSPSQAIVSPNPTSGRVEIRDLAAIRNADRGVVSDLTGKRWPLSAFVTESATDLLSLDFSELEPGIYLISGLAEHPVKVVLK